MSTDWRGRWRWGDVALGAVVVLLEALAHAGVAIVPGATGWLMWPATALAGIGVAIRRMRPGWGLAVVSASAALQMAALWPPSLVNLAQLIVVFSLAAGPAPRPRWTALGAAIAGALVAGVYTVVNFAVIGSPGGAPADPAEALLNGAIMTNLYLFALVLAWALGFVRSLVLRGRAAQVARQIAEIEGGHAREVADIERERGRIAREMHDVLAHSLVVIATLSDAARLAVDHDPAEAKGTVRTIGEVSRDALADVRRLLAELRHEQDAGPAASFADREELIERFAALGLDIRRTVEGAERPLTPGASLAAYRVVQEGLTNALRHGDARQPVELVERWSDDGLELAVRNTCRTGGEIALPAGGHGLAGLRERVLLEAGRFSAARAGDEFRLDAALPVGQAERMGSGMLEEHRDARAPAGAPETARDAAPTAEPAPFAAPAHADEGSELR